MLHWSHPIILANVPHLTICQCGARTVLLLAAWLMAANTPRPMAAWSRASPAVGHCNIISRAFLSRFAWPSLQPLLQISPVKAAQRQAHFNARHISSFTSSGGIVGRTAHRDRFHPLCTWPDGATQISPPRLPPFSVKLGAPPLSPSKPPSASVPMAGRRDQTFP